MLLLFASIACTRMHFFVYLCPYILSIWIFSCFMGNERMNEYVFCVCPLARSPCLNLGTSTMQKKPKASWIFRGLLGRTSFCLIWLSRLSIYVYTLKKERCVWRKTRGFLAPLIFYLHFVSLYFIKAGLLKTGPCFRRQKTYFLLTVAWPWLASRPVRRLSTRFKQIDKLMFDVFFSTF